MKMIYSELNILGHIKVKFQSTVISTKIKKNKNFSPILMLKMKLNFVGTQAFDIQRFIFLGQENVVNT